MLQFKSDKLIDYSHKLSKIHKSALPNAVRFTLTDAAKDVKFNTLQKHANKEFDVKKASFFRAFSAYEPAKGWDIGNMKATVGMIKKGNPKSVASTKVGKQQYAGTIKDRSYIPYENKKPKYDKKPIVTEKKGYFGKAIEADQKKVPLLVKKGKKGYLVKIKRINKKKADNPIVTEIIATYGENRDVKLKQKRPFLNNAALESGRKLNSFYIKNAQTQINRYR